MTIPEDKVIRRLRLYVELLATSADRRALYRQYHKR